MQNFHFSNKSEVAVAVTRVSPLPGSTLTILGTPTGVLFPVVRALVHPWVYFSHI
jgi:hypothetical protein